MIIRKSIKAYIYFIQMTTSSGLARLFSVIPRKMQLWIYLIKASYIPIQIYSLTFYIQDVQTRHTKNRISPYWRTHLMTTNITRIVSAYLNLRTTFKMTRGINSTITEQTYRTPNSIAP